MTGNQYQYRSSTGCGIFVIFSTLHLPEKNELVVAVKKATDCSWVDKPVYIDWIALFATEADAMTAVCNAVKNEGRTIQGGSEWILGGKTCP
jgi:hypothetical protein